jgi:hypothetical protein
VLVLFVHTVEKVVLSSVLIGFTYKCSRGAGSGLGEATCSGSAWSAPGAQTRFADEEGHIIWGTFSNTARHSRVPEILESIPPQ